MTMGARVVGQRRSHSVSGQHQPARPAPAGLLQRSCACGNHTIAGDECAACKAKKRQGVQTKLVVNEPGDVYEQEAERLADQAMAMPAAASPRGASPRIQRAVGLPGGREAPAPASVDRALAGAGSPLERGLRQEMEARFSHDFARVRIHTGSLAEQSAREVEAHAYTAGTDIVFGTGRFAPGTHAGRRLIAHELTHVVQQGGAPLSPSSPPGRLQREKAPPQPPPATGTCQAPTLADRFTPTTTWGGKPWDPTLDSSLFGTTSKLAANFGFGACKEGGVWKVHLDKLEVMITSKIQPVDFRINVAGANDAEVTKEKVSAILGDLRPNRQLTFRSGCGNDKYDDKVTTFSRRRTYWNRQLVEVHEAFHRKDWEAMYRAELVKAEGKVRSHTIPENEATDASAAVAKATPTLETYVIGAYGDACRAYSPQQEARAYDDGAPKYQKLVDEISARAVKEKWISAATQGAGSQQLSGPDLGPMPAEAEPTPGDTGNTPELLPEQGQAADRDAVRGTGEGGADEDSAALVDKLKRDPGGSDEQLPLTPRVVQWVTALRSGEVQPTETDPESALAENDPSKYPERRQEGEAFVWGEADRRAVDPSDVQQGYLGDCYFMALLAAIAEVRPQAIEQMVKPNDDGTFTVSFLGPDGTRVHQKVEPTFPSYKWGEPAYAKFGERSEVYGKELWPMLIEKAWKQANGSWLGMEGGKVDTKKHAMAMTGGAREDYPLPGKLTDGALFDRVSRHFLAKQPATAFSPKATDESKKKALKTGVITNHAYALWNVHPAGKTVDLYNPHGPESEHLLAKTMSFLKSNFRSIVFFTLKAAGLKATNEGPTKEEQLGAEAVPKQILKDSGYDLLVAELATQLPATTTQLTARDTVEAFGQKLWEHSKVRAQDPKNTNTDDRPLYWARLAAVAFVRSFVPSSYTLTPVEKQGLIDVLEASSRGRTSIDFPAPVPGGLRRVLVSGFDPFGLRSEGLNKANPSGAAVLALDGQTVPSAPGGTDGRLEGVIFPVRFADFDRAIVETTFRPYLTNAAKRVDMIMTISQGGSRLDLGAKKAKQSEAFELERYAGRRRAPSGPDNLEVDPVKPGELKEGKRLGAGPEFLESSLPRKEMSGREEIPAEVERKTEGGKAVEGSGGGFLSNEIFYRTALLRANEKSTVPVGHLHVPYQPAPAGPAKSEKEHNRLRDAIVGWVRKLIGNALKALGKKKP